MTQNYQTIHGPISARPTAWNFDWKGDLKVIQGLIASYIASKPQLELIFPETPSIMAELRKNFEVLIVTHYPDPAGRQANLQSLGIYPQVHYDELICVGSTSAKVDKIYELRPRYYAEDAPHVIEGLIGRQIDFDLTIYVPTTYEYSSKLPTLAPLDHISIKRYDHLSELLSLQV